MLSMDPVRWSLKERCFTNVQQWQVGRMVAKGDVCLRLRLERVGSTEAGYVGMAVVRLVL